MNMQTATKGIATQAPKLAIMYLAATPKISMTTMNVTALAMAMAVGLMASA